MLRHSADNYYYLVRLAGVGAFRESVNEVWQCYILWSPLPHFQNLRLLIEKNAQVALQSKLGLLQRQMEVANKGEQAWKGRAVELQAHLNAVQEELVKTTSEKESLKIEVSKLQEQLGISERKLQDRVNLLVPFYNLPCLCPFV